MKRKKLLEISLAVLSIILLSMTFMVSCQKAATPTTQTTAPVTQTTAPVTQTTTPAPKTLKIGVIAFLGWPLGIEFEKGVQLQADMINAKGGLDIGGEKYTIQPVIYDSKFDQVASRSAASRLMDVDKVKFIVGDDTIAYWASLTDPEHVIAIGLDATGTIFNPDYKYTFQGTVAAYTNSPTAWGWFVKNHPNIKTIVLAAPDSQPGHAFGDQLKKLSEAFGPKMLDEIYYPPSATDLSAVGTKVKTLNPDAFIPTAGGPVTDPLIIKAVSQAGWKGQFFMTGTVGASVYDQTVLPEVTEGMIVAANDVEMDTPPVGAAKDFKDAYIAKNGKWDDPDITQLNAWYVLIAALQKAGSLDVDKVANVLANGLQYDSPCCSPSIMISRPDLGITRTVDTLGSLAIKQMVGGKASIIAKISLDEALGYNKTFYGWK